MQSRKDSQLVAAKLFRCRFPHRLGARIRKSRDVLNTIKGEEGVATNDEYDWFNRLVKRGNIEIFYDHEGNRVRKVVNGTATHYLVDSQNPTGCAQVIAEYTGSSPTTLVTAYTPGLDLISQRSGSGTLHYFGYDDLGSVRKVYESTGTEVDSYDYDAWGVLENTPNFITNYRYTGEQWIRIWRCITSAPDTTNRASGDSGRWTATRAARAIRSAFTNTSMRPMRFFSGFRQ